MHTDLMYFFTLLEFMGVGVLQSTLNAGVMLTNLDEIPEVLVVRVNAKFGRPQMATERHLKAI